MLLLPLGSWSAIFLCIPCVCQGEICAHRTSGRGYRAVTAPSQPKVTSGEGWAVLVGGAAVTRRGMKFMPGDFCNKLFL